MVGVGRTAFLDDLERSTTEVGSEPVRPRCPDKNSSQSLRNGYLLCMVASGQTGMGLAQRVRQAITTASGALVVNRSEVVVHQAIGIVMEIAGCPNLVALDALVGWAEQAGQPLLAVAVDLVERQGR